MWLDVSGAWHILRGGAGQKSFPFHCWRAMRYRIWEIGPLAFMTP
jgi:hypothetical protein